MAHRLLAIVRELLSEVKNCPHIRSVDGHILERRIIFKVPGQVSPAHCRRNRIELVGQGYIRLPGIFGVAGTPAETVNAGSFRRIPIDAPDTDDTVPHAAGVGYVPCSGI